MISFSCSGTTALFRRFDRRLTWHLTPVLTAFLLSLPSASAEEEDPPTQRVGLPITLTDLYIPGGEARPKPRPNREPPLVLRLLDTRPAADGLRYDLEIYGLEPGTYNVAEYIEAVDPATPPELPEIPLVITTELPPGLPRPAELTSSPPSRIGGYRLVIWILGIVWVLGLLAFLFWKRRPASAPAEPVPPPTLEERLRALLMQASQGELDTGQQASLERLILGHWKQRLPELDRLPPVEALTKLRHHEEAGPLLLQLERWLHARNSQISSDQIDELLAPYRD